MTVSKRIGMDIQRKRMIPYFYLQKQSTFEKSVSHIFLLFLIGMQQAQDKPVNKTANLERVEEDDEFEEFERDGQLLPFFWFIDYPRSDITLSDSIHWEDNWDTANGNDEFTAQFRAELEKNKSQ